MDMIGLTFKDRAPVPGEEWKYDVDSSADSRCAKVSGGKYEGKTVIPWEGRKNIGKVLIIVNIEFPNTYIYEVTIVLKPHLSLVHYRLSLGKPCHFWSW